METPGQSALCADCPFFLSKRQREVLTYAAQGLTDRATARQLALSPRTVRAYLQQARRTLGAVNTTHAVAIAVGHGLIKLDAFFSLN